MTQAEPVIIPAGVVRDRLKAAILDGRVFAPRRYQADRLASESRFNLDLWSRQTGKSQTAAQDAVHLAAETGESVMNLSASLDLTRELMVKVAQYAEVIVGVAGEIQRAVARGELDEVLYVDQDGVKITQTVITLPAGERIIGRPANPRTARGFSMHVKLDEFGMHRDQDEIWAAAFPSITSRDHLRLDVMSTPGLRTDDKFATLVRDAQNGASDFVLRKVTIHDAIRDGLKADAEKLRRNLGDEDRWRREYLCEFVDEAGAFLTYDLIRSCEHEGLPLELSGGGSPEDWDAKSLGWNPADGDLYLGIDIGRKHDLTVFWLLQVIGDVAWTRMVRPMRNVPFSVQLEYGSLLHRKLPIRRTAVDATGLGAMLAEEWQRLHGTMRVEALTYTANLKAALANPLRAKFQDRLLRIPVDAQIRESLHSVRKAVTAAGNIRFMGERTADGHADEFWALANAVHAMDHKITAGAILL